ncbi:hypothetical protein JFT67_07700 [Pseudomonas simiae]|uniref:hypothetical protein n=1 Tax=Pseudomonas simiae TaxID=321846 RepID=UPI0018E6F4E0|nr:hypothetical protein [Pseudomonas simiae]MBJ2228928.1 hypothetical protein [Pseudomonas simiae]
MSDQTDYLEEKIISKKGQPVPCRYRQHFAWDRELPLCIALDFVFKHYAGTRTNSNGYLLLTAIETFMTVVHQHNSVNPAGLAVTRFEHITSDLLSRYIHYIQANEIPISYAERLKTALIAAAKETGKIPLLVLPIVPQKPRKETEPLESEAFDALETALRSHIDGLYAKLEFRKLVDASEPYTWPEINKHAYPEISREEVLGFCKFNGGHSWSQKAKKQVLAAANRCSDPVIQTLAQSGGDVLHVLINMARTEPALAPLDSIPVGKPPGPAAWSPELPRLLKTLFVHGYPFEMPLDLIETRYSKPKDVQEHYRDDLISMIMYRLKRMNWSETAAPLPLLDDLLGLYYPTELDMTALVLFIMLQSNWNKEVVLAVDRNNFEHALTATIEDSLRVVFSEKQRSQSNNTEYLKPQRQNAPTSTKDPYSIYNMIRLSNQLAKPLMKYEMDYIPQGETKDSMNPLYFCIRDHADWLNKGGRHTSIANPKAFRIGVKYFLEKYEIIEKGERLTGAQDLTRRLRPTWTAYKKKTHPISMLSRISLGHKDQSTTDIYYDNHAQAQTERFKRLRVVFEEIMDLLRSRQFKGLLLTTHARQQASGDIKFFHIPGHRRAMWGCRDQMKPDWAGAHIIREQGKKCFELDQCIFCSQIWIFEDSLPYLIERMSHLMQEMEEDDDIIFSSRIASEIKALEFILDNWPVDEEDDDEDVITKAEKFQRLNKPLLPRNLNSLKLLFESESLDV